MTEFIHIGVDIETYYEKNKKFPELDTLGWISEVQQSKLSKALGPRRPSAPPEDTYYAGVIKVIEESIRNYPKWFRKIASRVKASIDDTVQGRMLSRKIVALDKLSFTIVQLAPALSPQYGKFENLIAYMIPDALMEMADTSLSGKVITLLGFSGMGKQAAQAIRDVAGGKVIIVENDPNLALTASLNGFDVKSFD